MRRIIVFLLIAMLMGTYACAEGSGPSGGQTIGRSQKVQIDLDGDGRDETVRWAMVPGDYDQCLQLRVITAEGAVLTWDTEIIYGEGVWACDLDGDGLVELFAWGDVMSDDYFTYCIHYDGRGLKPVLFADGNRGENGNGYFKEGYGLLEGTDPSAGTITLCGSQDMLGTYFMSRTMRLDEDGLFEFEDDGWWVRDVSGLMGDEEYWTYGALTLTAAVPCELEGRTQTLKPGDRIMITGTDKATAVSFVTRDGRTGTLEVSENYEKGWGTLVAGRPEEELFEFVPYAD